MRKYISKYITYKEYECSHCRRLPTLFYHDDGGRKNTVPTIYVPLLEAFKDIRTRWGGPIKISSGYRCVKHSKQMFEDGISSAYLSTHVFGMALDLDMPNEEAVKSLVKLIEKYQPELRIGYNSYLYRGQSLIHIDMGFLISPPYSRKLYRGCRW